MANASVNNATARRIEKLLQYLGVDALEFSKKTGLDRSYVSRLMAGTRAGHGGTLHSKVRDAFGIDARYWTSPIDLEPAQCRTTSRFDVAPRRVLPQAEVGSGGSSAKDAIMEVAVQRGDGPEVLLQLLRAQPPDGKEQSLAWWVAFYMDLLTVR